MVEFDPDEIEVGGSSPLHTTIVRFLGGGKQTHVSPIEAVPLSADNY